MGFLSQLLSDAIVIAIGNIKISKHDCFQQFTKISNGPDLASEKYFANSKHHYLNDDYKACTNMG